MASYKFVRSISEGAFGRVYLAEDTDSGQQVAIKELKQLDASSRARFERELRLLAEQIDNQFVVDVLDYNFDASPPIIVMEYCDGGSLRQWVHDRQPWQVVAGALGHVAEGLAGIHKAGGFHRDIKPDNLLLARVDDEGAVVKVADFGLARVPQIVGSAMTYGGYGTPGYIAPEVILGADFHSGADIYSLGVVALELLTGTNEVRVLEGFSAPQLLKELIRGMLSRATSKRPNIQRVAKILDELLNFKPPASPAVVPPPSKPSSTPAKRAAVALGVGAVALLALGGLAYLAANSPEWDEYVQRYRGKNGRFRSG